MRTLAAAAYLGTQYLAAVGFANQAAQVNLALLEQGEIYLRGLVGEPDGSKILRAEVRGSSERAHELGVELAQQLIAQGADRILARLMSDGG